MCDEIDWQVELKQSILCESTIQFDSTTKCQEGICSKTAKK